jgi:hypothetical protein
MTASVLPFAFCLLLFAFYKDLALMARRRGIRIEARALRGGSWNNTTENLRCAARNNNHPDNQWNNNGFRVVCAANHAHLFVVAPSGALMEALR